MAMIDDDKKKALSEMNARLNAWLVSCLQKPKRTRRLSLAEAWLDAQRARLRMKRFGHY